MEVPPEIIELKFCTASNPVISRMDVPEFPTFKRVFGAFNPLRPTPETLIVELEVSIETPRCLKMEIVFLQSSDIKKLLNLDVFDAMDPIMMALCEMDLSPGMVLIVK